MPLLTRAKKAEDHQEQLNLTMKFAAVFLSSLVGSCVAAPALVWKTGRDASSSVVHSSTPVHASEVIADVMGSSESLAAIFLVGRSADGSESLSAMTSSGSLPGVASKYEEASTIHHHCGGVESPHAMGKMANSLSISLSEFSSILENPNPTDAAVEVDQTGMFTKADKDGKNRARALAVAKLVIVNIPASTNPADIDSAVVKAIESDKVGSVVLTGIRSTEEVKLERTMASRRRVLVQQAGVTDGGRRLEQQNDDANAGNKDMTGVYYVQMTPNILAGILFGLLFAFIAYTGISCMGMITGQDVFVTKMPTVGREA
jgi:hypothetical protein